MAKQIGQSVNSATRTTLSFIPGMKFCFLQADSNHSVRAARSLNSVHDAYREYVGEGQFEAINQRRLLALCQSKIANLLKPSTLSVLGSLQRWAKKKQTKGQV